MGMFKEEWAKRRPNLANLSIWTLVSYARKFDTMKKQLITTHNQVNRVGDRRRKDFVEDIESSSAVVYFDNSTIPKYDLDEIKNLHLPKELKDLISTRQTAKLRQESEDEKHLTFYHLWEDEWTKLSLLQTGPGIKPETPANIVKPKGKAQRTPGGILHQRLFLLENRPGFKSKLKQAVLRTSKPKTKDTTSESNDENLRIKPRSFVFPEADQEGLNIFCYVDVPLPKGQKERWYVELERDVYNKDSLLIPMLEDGRGPADEEDEVTKFPPKAQKHCKTNLSGKFQIRPTNSDDFECQSCPTFYTNLNNLKYHQELHHEVSVT